MGQNDLGDVDQHHDDRYVLLLQIQGMKSQSASSSRNIMYLAVCLPRRLGLPPAGGMEEATRAHGYGTEQVMPNRRECE